MGLPDQLQQPLLPDGRPQQQQQWPGGSLPQQHEATTIIVEDAALDTGWQEELRRLLSLAAPSALTGVLAYSGRLMTTAQVGRLSSLSLSRLSLAITVYNISGASLVLGVASGITTYVGQAHGASQAGLKGLILQRGMLLSLLMSLVPLAAWSQVERLLQLLGQDPAIASGAAAFIHALSPALLLYAATCSLEFYLLAQGLVLPLILVHATALLMPLLNSVFVFRLGYDFLGNAASMGILLLLQLAILITIVARHNSRQPPGHKPWPGFLLAAAASAWRPYLTVALPSLAMICLDWWAFETLTILAGLLPDAEVAVAAVGIGIGIHIVTFLLIEGYSNAVCVRVSNELGAGRPRVAARAVKAGVLLGLLTTLACVIPIALVPRAVARLFTHDEQVVEIVVACLPALLLSLVFDSVNNVLSGCIRGAGRQALGSCVNFFCYWVVGLPFAWQLARRFGAPGVWMGMCATSALQAAVLAAVFAGVIDWQAESERSKALVRSQAAAPAPAPATRAGSSDAFDDDVSRRRQPDSRLELL